MLCEISLVDARARTKPCYASALHAWVGQVRAGFAEKTVLRARLLSYSSSAAIFPRKPWFLSSMLGSAQVRAGFAEKTLLRAV